MLLLLMLTAPILAQGMFDLPSGKWATLDSPHFVVLIGTPKDRKMTWEVGKLQVHGTYKVNSNKGQPSFQVNVDTIMKDGKAVTEADVAGLQLKKGESVRCIISWEELGGFQMTAFDKDIQTVWTRHFKKAK